MSAALVDQTMVCEASRLLDRIPVGEDFVEHLRRTGTKPLPGEYPMAQRMLGATTAERLIHLATLLDTLLLYEHVYVLAAELPPDADALTLRRVLVDQGILRVLDTREHAQPVADELAAHLSYAGRVTNVTHWGGGRADPAYVADAVQATLAELDEGHRWRQFRKRSVQWSRDDELTDALRADLDVARPGRWRDDRFREEPIVMLGGELLNEVGYWYSGTVIYAASALRTFVYWRLAARLNLPFVPSLPRLPQYHLMTDHIRRSAQEQVYEVIAESFQAAVAEVHDGDRPLRLYLPPALSLFLDELRAGRDVAGAVEELRSTHRRLRRVLALCQRDLADGETLGEVRKARRRLADALVELRDHFDGPHESAIDQLIDIAPDVAQVAANPLDPRGFADGLSRRPARWLRGWWRRRPLRPAFALRDRLLGLRRYDQLLEEAVGVRLDPDELSRLIGLYESSLRIYGGESRLPSDTR